MDPDYPGRLDRRQADEHLDPPGFRGRLNVQRLQLEIRRRNAGDLATIWSPDVPAAGGDLTAREPPSEWWAVEGRHELTHEFLTEVAEEYLHYGRGYAKQMAITPS